MMSALHGATYEEKLEELDMTMLEERRHRADVIQVFKILMGRLMWTETIGSEWQQGEW